MLYSDVFGSVRLDLMLVACLVSIVVIVKAYRNRRKNLPPGPFCLPVIGHIPLLFNEPHLEAMKLGQKYGDVFSFRYGSQEGIMLNSGKAAKEFLSKPELIDRPDQKSFLTIPSEDFFFGNGLGWREHKKFALKVFRDLNAGKALEERIKDEIKRFMDILLEQNGMSFDARDTLFSSLINVMVTINVGDHFERDSQFKKMIDKFMTEIMKTIEKSLIFILFPWMSQVGLIKKMLKMDGLRKTYYDAFDFKMSHLRKLKEVPKDERTQSLAAAYVDEMVSPSSDKSTFSETALVHGLITLYGAGAETTSSSLIWALYTMAVYGDVQTKVQREIDEVVGIDRMPAHSDQKEMKYTQAVLMEMQRWKTIVPLGIRIVKADTTFRTYRVPKDTIVFVNHYCIHHDSRCWKDPDDFKPERFLSANGEHILKNDNFMPFSYGRRSCTGEGIALMNIFLFFTSILQKFRVKLPDGDKPNFQGFGTLVYQMKYRRLCFMPRDA